MGVFTGYEGVIFPRGFLDFNINKVILFVRIFYNVSNIIIFYVIKFFNYTLILLHS